MHEKCQKSPGFLEEVAASEENLFLGVALPEEGEFELYGQRCISSTGQWN